MMTEAMKSEDCYFLAGAMTNLDSVLQSRDITLLTKVCIVKAVVFPVVMYSYEGRPTKKAEGQRIDFSALSPTLTSIHDYWKNHRFDYIDLCQQSDVSAFYYAA